MATMFNVIRGLKFLVMSYKKKKIYYTQLIYIWKPYFIILLQASKISRPTLLMRVGASSCMTLFVILISSSNLLSSIFEISDKLFLTEKRNMVTYASSKQIIYRIQMKNIGIKHFQSLLFSHFFIFTSYTLKCSKQPLTLPKNENPSSNGHTSKVNPIIDIYFVL